MVVLNRFDAEVDLHVRNIEWLRRRGPLSVSVVLGGASELAEVLKGLGSTPA